MTSTKNLIIAATLLAMASCANPADNKETSATTAAPATTEAAPAAEPTPTLPDSATAAKNWMEAMTPGKMHEMLASRVGVWTAEMTMWMAEGAPPSTTKGEAQYKMIMGGRYLQTTYKATMDNMPFEGMSLSAWDNAAQKLTETWIDNMGTGIMIVEGTYNEATKATETKGTCMDPALRVEKEVREVTTMTDATHMTMEMYETIKGGKERKTMEIKYTKK
jgi:hypothetical protein